MLPLVYDELRRLAARYLRQERPGHTLQTTALVHEAYMRLVHKEHGDWKNRAQFLEKGAQTLRYCDAYSNSHRGKRAKSTALVIDSLPHSAAAVEPETEWIKLRRKSWAALIRLVYEADPLLCPKCHNQMKIISVIKDGTVIDKILAHLQYKFEPLRLAAARPPRILPLKWDFFSAD